MVLFWPSFPSISGPRRNYVSWYGRLRRRYKKSSNFIMFFSKLSAFVLTAASLCFNAAAIPSIDCGYHHVANTGDTCDSIAYRTGTTVQNIRSCNSWISSTCNNVVAGSDVRYPTTGLTKPNWTCSGPEGYTVRKGDTCESIAAALKVDIGSIYFCNPINAGCTNLFPGQKISIILK